jgi:hypothetical protein
MSSSEVPGESNPLQMQGQNTTPGAPASNASQEEVPTKTLEAVKKLSNLGVLKTTANGFGTVGPWKGNMLHNMINVIDTDITMTRATVWPSNNFQFTSNFKKFTSGTYEVIGDELIGPAALVQGGIMDGPSIVPTELTQAASTTIFGDGGLNISLPMLRAKGTFVDGETVFRGVYLALGMGKSGKGGFAGDVLAKAMLVTMTDLSYYHTGPLKGNFLGTRPSTTWSVAPSYDANHCFPFTWDQDNAAVPIDVEARVITMADAMGFAAGQKGAADAGWEPEEWGSSIAIVPVRSTMVGGTDAMAEWTTYHMEHPFVMWAGTQEEYTANGTLITPAVEVGNFANYVSWKGHKSRILYVIVDCKVASNGQVVSLPTVSLDTSVNGISGGASVDIAADLLNTFASTGNARANKRWYSAKDNWFSMYGATEDVVFARSLVAELAFALPRGARRWTDTSTTTGATNGVVNGPVTCGSSAGSTPPGYNNMTTADIVWAEAQVPSYDANEASIASGWASWTTPMYQRRSMTRTAASPPPRVDFDSGANNVVSHSIPNDDWLGRLMIAGRYYAYANQYQGELRDESATQMFQSMLKLATGMSAAAEDVCAIVGIPRYTAMYGTSNLLVYGSNTVETQNYLRLRVQDGIRLLMKSGMGTNWITLTFAKNNASYWLNGLDAFEQGAGTIGCDRLDYALRMLYWDEPNISGIIDLRSVRNGQVIDKSGFKSLISTTHKWNPKEDPTHWDVWRTLTTGRATMSGVGVYLMDTSGRLYCNDTTLGDLLFQDYIDGVSNYNGTTFAGSYNWYCEANRLVMPIGCTGVPRIVSGGSGTVSTLSLNGYRVRGEFGTPDITQVGYSQELVGELDGLFR